MPPSNASPQKARDEPSRLSWRPTKMMNMRDLSKDDDFLSHLLVEKLGTGTVPLLVHKMDPSRRLPKTDAHDLLQIVRRLVVMKGPLQHVIRQAVDELLLLSSIRYYLRPYTQKQINAFATHASRYFELYHPSGSIEISHTSRYSHRTGKSELCILATRFMPAGTVITELKGSMADLTDAEDRELKRTDLRNCDIRRDFSVIHSKQMKKNHLFLGPARFVNHDCNNNCELFREGRYITFRTLRPIVVGQEITAHYGDGYFGKKNRHCLCETCEKRGRGGYSPVILEDEELSSDSSSDSDSDSESDTSSSDSDSEEEELQRPLNLDERRTRRGVYHIAPKSDSEDSDEEGDDVVPLANATDVPAEGDIELTTAAGDSVSALTPLHSSGTQSNIASSVLSDLTSLSRSSSSVSTLSSLPTSSASPTTSTAALRPIMHTRRQVAVPRTGASQSPSVKAKATTSPLATNTPSLGATETPSKRITRSTASLLTPTMAKGKGKAKEVQSAPVTPTPRRGRRKAVAEEVLVKKEEIEPRLRRRASQPSTSIEGTKEPEAVKVILGPDGIPLPLCSTCSSVLPVISVDAKVVWGLGLEVASSSKSKSDKQHCPRCLRHFAIYGQRWPRRFPAPGTVTSFLLTPREVTPKASPSKHPSKHSVPKTLSVVDKKLAAATAAKSRRDLSDDRPHKRLKTESSRDTEKSNKKNKAISQVISSSTGGKRHESPEPVAQIESVKRKRGRPRLSTNIPPPAKVKIEEDDTSKTFDQPRSFHGRFDRKVSSGPTSPTKKVLSPVRPLLSRAERVLEREKQKEILEKQSEDSPSKKRGGGDEEPNGSPRKKTKWKAEDLQKVIPRSSNLRAGTLLSKPNPMNFALSAWKPPLRTPSLVADEDSSGDDTGPVTPEDHPSPPLTDESSSAVPFKLPTKPSALTYKPTPFNFARRRWSSTPKSHVEETVKHFKPRRSLPGQNAVPNDLDLALFSAETSLDQSYYLEEDANATPRLLLDDVLPGGLMHVYPMSAGTKVGLFHKSGTFTSTVPHSAPHFIDVAWEISSDTSDN